jgi:ribosomal protein L40E
VQLKDLKHVFLGAIIGAFIWFAIIEVDSRADIHVYWQLYPIGDLIFVSLAVLIGTYVGMWTVGRIRKPSIKFGILEGLFSFVLIDLFDAFGLWIYWAEQGWGTYRIETVLIPNLQATILVRLAPSLAAGLLGMILIRRFSPSFCPNCGNRLPPGPDACSKCGTKV